MIRRPATGSCTAACAHTATGESLIVAAGPAGPELVLLLFLLEADTTSFDLVVPTALVPAAPTASMMALTASKSRTSHAYTR